MAEAINCMPDSLESLAWTLWETEKYEEALPLLEQLYLTDTDTEDKIAILDAIAYCHSKMQRYDEAIRTYNRILEVDPCDFDTINNIGTMLWKQGDAKGAVRVYRESIDKGNVDKDDLLYLVKLYRQLKTPEDELYILNILVKHHSDYAPGYEAIGYIEDQRNNYKEALIAYRQAILLGADSPFLVKRALFMTLNLRQFAVAKKAFLYNLKHSRKYFIEDAEFIYGLAVAEHHTDDNLRAIKHLRRAIEIQPDFPLASQLLESIQNHIGGDVYQS